MRKDETPSAMYNELVEAIVKAMPEIMELKFGCLVKMHDEISEFIQENPLVCMQCECTSGVHLKMPNQAGSMSPQSFCKHRFEEWFEILGRPITLEDVLKAKNSKIDADFAQWKDDEYKPPYGTVGNIKKGLKRKYDEKLLAIWLLGKTLSEQSDETISFLHSLLCKL